MTNEQYEPDQYEPYLDEAERLDYVRVVGKPSPTEANPNRRLMLVEFSPKDDLESTEAFTWAPVWKDVVHIVVQALLVENRNTKRKTEELLRALEGIVPIAKYLNPSKPNDAVDNS